MSAYTSPSTRVAKPWVRTYSDMFSTLAMDTDRPAWDRVAMYAYSIVARNGHAHTNPSDLSVVLGITDPRNVRRAIYRAIDKGLLLPGSNRRCLIVPGHWVSGGVVGGEHDLCERHQ